MKLLTKYNEKWRYITLCSKICYWPKKMSPDEHS